MANDKQRKSVDEPKGHAHNDAAADAELAAMAELASAPLREAQSKRKTTDADQAKRTPQTKAKRQTTEDSVTLPIERTVKAFVQGITPRIEDMPPLSEDEDGISLDAALEDFMLDAKKVSNALPPPVVDDEQLADLARIPVASIETPAPLPHAPRQGTSLGNLIVAAGLGAALAVGAVTLMRSGNRTTVPSTPTQPPSTPATTAPTPTAAKLPAPVATMPQSDATPTAATTTPDAAPAAATTTPDAAPTATTTTPDAAPTAATTTPDAAPADAAKKAVTTGGKAARVAAKTKRIRRKSKVARRKLKRATRKSVKKTVARTKKKRTKKKKKAAGGDWVDPFSQ